MSKNLVKTFNVFNFARLNDAQLYEAMRAQRKRLSMIDVNIKSEEATLLDVALQIDAIKGIQKYRERTSS